MNPDFYLKLKLLSRALDDFKDNSMPGIIPAIDRLIEHIESGITPYCVLLEKLRDLRAKSKD